MSSMKAPSLALLRSFLRPNSCHQCQSRGVADWMPRSKYVKITALDKLHRKQKADLRRERLESCIRANSMRPPPYAPKPTPDSSQSHTTAESPPNLPYIVHRTSPSHSLPIYESAKSGGTKHITTIRKLSGDLQALQAHLRDALGLDQFVVDRQGRKKENIAINWRTKHLIVRGWRGAECKKWAEMVGF